VNDNTDTHPFTILVVDDDHDVLAANARFLRIQGFEVAVADRAKTALERLREQEIDVVVTDLIMPDADGLTFARQLRILYPLTPIVFFSGNANVPDVVGAKNISFRTRVLAYEKFIIESSLNEHDGSVAKVIDALKINRRTLNDKMLRLGIRR